MLQILVFPGINKILSEGRKSFPQGIEAFCSCPLWQVVPSLFEISSAEHCKEEHLTVLKYYSTSSLMIHFFIDENTSCVLEQQQQKKYYFQEKPDEINPGSNTLPKFLAAPCSSVEDEAQLYYLEWVFAFSLNCMWLLRRCWCFLEGAIKWHLQKKNSQVQSVM